MKCDTLVITVTLGKRESLERTVDSVKNIGGSRTKHILITTDEAQAQLKEKYPHLDIYTEPEDNKGLYSSLNFAFFNFAKNYKYLTYINDDDYWLPNYINLYKALDNNDKIDVVYGKVVYVSANNNLLGEQTSSPRYKSFKNLYAKNIVLFTQQSTLMRSDVFFKVGGFSESYKLVADSEFWMKAIDICLKFRYINTVCAAYTMQSDQLSSNSNLQAFENSIIINKFKSKYVSSIFETILFRSLNVKVYFRRMIAHKFKIMRIENFRNIS